MDRAEILSAMDTLKLYGMKGAFDAVITAAVKRQHEPHRTGVGIDPDALQAATMPSQFVDGDAWRNLGITVVERDTPGVDLPHRLADVIDRERTTKVRVTHTRAGGVSNLRCLQVKAGVAKRVQGSGMIVVKVRDDDVFYGFRYHSDHRQRLTGGAQQSALSLLSFGFVETSVHHNGAMLVSYYPEEEIDLVRSVVIVGRDEAFDALPVGSLSIFDGENFVCCAGHGGVALKLAASSNVQRRTSVGLGDHQDNGNGAMITS